MPYPARRTEPRSAARRPHLAPGTFPYARSQRLTTMRTCHKSRVARVATSWLSVMAASAGLSTYFRPRAELQVHQSEWRCSTQRLGRLSTTIGLDVLRQMDATSLRTRPRREPSGSESGVEEILVDVEVDAPVRVRAEEQPAVIRRDASGRTSAQTAAACRTGSHQSTTMSSVTLHASRQLRMDGVPVRAAVVVDHEPADSVRPVAPVAPVDQPLLLVDPAARWRASTWTFVRDGTAPGRSTWTSIPNSGRSTCKSGRPGRTLSRRRTCRGRGWFGRAHRTPGRFFDDEPSSPARKPHGRAGQGAPVAGPVRAAVRQPPRGPRLAGDLLPAGPDRHVSEVRVLAARRRHAGRADSPAVARDHGAVPEGAARKGAARTGAARKGAENDREAEVLPDWLPQVRHHHALGFFRSATDTGGPLERRESRAPNAGQSRSRATGPGWLR